MSIDIKSKKEFIDAIKKKRKLICLYYWKNCGHCHTFLPVWRKVTSLHNIPSLSVELNVIKTLDPEYQIYAFPTVVLYENGVKQIEIAGARSEEDFHKFITKHFVKKTKKQSKMIK